MKNKNALYALIMDVITKMVKSKMYSKQGYSSVNKKLDVCGCWTLWKILYYNFERSNQKYLLSRIKCNQ